MDITPDFVAGFRALAEARLGRGSQPAAPLIPLRVIDEPGVETPEEPDWWLSVTDAQIDAAYRKVIGTDPTGQDQHYVRAVVREAMTYAKPMRLQPCPKPPRKASLGPVEALESLRRYEATLPPSERLLGPL